MILKKLKQFSRYFTKHNPFILNLIDRNNLKYKEEIQPAIWYVFSRFMWFLVASAILFTIWIFSTNKETHTIINVITIITALIAILILFFDAYKSWEQSIEKKLSVFFIEENQVDNKKCTSIKMAYIRARLTHEGDIRALGQQLGVQMLRLFIESHPKYSKAKNGDNHKILGQTFLTFDAGEIRVISKKHTVIDVSKTHILDYVLLVKLHKFNDNVKSYLHKDYKDDEKLIIDEFSDSYLIASHPIYSKQKPVPHKHCMNGQDIPSQIFKVIENYVDYEKVDINENP